mgnify:CR=1 FL=1
MSDLIYLIVLIGLGYFVGTRVEKQHYNSIKEREKKFLYLPVVGGDDLLDESDVSESRLD